jgi:arsenate reductase-like glutaredoxin family protein
VLNGGGVLNIQIFGKSKCFDTKKAERYFKERRIKYQSIDLIRYGMSGKEFDSVLRAVGGIDRLIDWESKDPDILLLKYMDDTRAKEDKVFENPKLMKTPVVRNGKLATVGFAPEQWKEWE